MSHGPNDAASQWLLDQMHDPEVLLRHRIECAKTLLENHPTAFNVRWMHDPNEPLITVIIEGIGAGPLPSVAPAHQRTSIN